MNKSVTPEHDDEENMFWRASVEAKTELRLAKANFQMAKDKKEALEYRWKTLHPPSAAEIEQKQCGAIFGGGVIGFFLSWVFILLHALVYKMHLCADK